MDLYVIIMICYFPEYGRGLLLLLVGVTEGRGDVYIHALLGLLFMVREGPVGQKLVGQLTVGQNT